MTAAMSFLPECKLNVVQIQIRVQRTLDRRHGSRMGKKRYKSVKSDG